MFCSMGVLHLYFSDGHSVTIALSSACFLMWAWVFWYLPPLHAVCCPPSSLPDRQSTLPHEHILPICPLVCPRLLYSVSIALFSESASTDSEYVPACRSLLCQFLLPDMFIPPALLIMNSASLGNEAS